MRNEPGVLEDSDIQYHLPSEFARKNLFFLHAGGRYRCVPPYRIERDHYDMMLILFILQGAMHVEYRGCIGMAEAGDVILMDCRNPHRYWISGETRFMWMHFDGNASEAYLELIQENRGCIIRTDNPSLVDECLEILLEQMRDGHVNEHEASAQLHRMLGSLAAPNVAPRKITDAITCKAIAFMEAHSGEQLNISQMAAHVNLSPFHFSRLFKRHALFAPHEYLVTIRLKRAIHMLRNEDCSIEEIASRAGFNSPSHFIRSFRLHMKMTPGQYRQFRF